MKKTIVTKKGKTTVDYTPEQEQAFLAKLEAQRVKSLQEELENLQGQLAFRGFIWMIKREIAAGRMTKDDLPAQAVAAYDRIQEIEAELNN